MSGKLPALTGAEVIQALQRGGFSVVRVRGSHHFLRHTDGRATVVPVHSGETIGSGLISKVSGIVAWIGNSSAACSVERLTPNPALQPPGPRLWRLVTCWSLARPRRLSLIVRVRRRGWYEQHLLPSL